MSFGRGLVGLMSLCLPLAAGSAGATVAVYADLPSSAPASVQSAMERETQRILGAAGFQIVWRPLSERDGSESFENLAVFRFSGTCSPFTTESASGLAGRSLADTAVSDGRVLPFTVFHCDRVARLLAATTSRLASVERNATLGRALGRIAAHELYHILGQTRAHDTGGVSKACFSPSDLTKSSFRLETTALAQIRPDRAAQPQDPGETWTGEPAGR